MKKTTEKVFKVNAKNENQALEIITNYVFNNNILDTKDDDIIDFSVEEINEEFDENCDDIEEEYVLFLPYQKDQIQHKRL